MKTQTTAITDEQRLVSAHHYRGHPIPVYDDGFGPLWIHRDSMGISGIVRAQTWEDAYSICEDEFFPEADETIDEIRADYGFKREHIKMIHPLNEYGHIDYGVTRPAVLADYPEGGLRDGQFVEWKTVETPDPEAWPDNELFQEGYGFRPNGPNARDTHKHGIYAKDLNGDVLDRLTDELCQDLGITIKIEDYE